MKIDKLISVVAPAYNEADNVRHFYEEIKKTLDKVTTQWEIICINDGSTDDTLHQLLALHAIDNRVKIINLSRNFGKEAALTAGLDEAKGEAIIPIDFDLQDPPELILQMIEKWQEGFDVVYATRITREGETFFKKMTANYFYKLIGKISNIDIPKNTGDYRLIDKKVLEHLNQLKETRRFMKGLFAWVGFKQTSISFIRKSRYAGETKFNYFKLWNFAIEGITSFSIAPLQLAMYVGFSAAIFAFLYSIIIVIKTLIFGIDLPGYSSLMVTMLFIGGVQLISIGIIGEYVGRIYDEVKNRPIYIIEKKYI